MHNHILKLALNKQKERERERERLSVSMPQETAYVHQDCTNSSSSIVPQHDALLISWNIVPPSECICIINPWCDFRILSFYSYSAKAWVTVIREVGH